ncbi:MAG: signal peptidase I [Oscillospiraceae bacterium]|nr:signal peptidase I [Oscillospiraceae bacterium]
MEEKNGFSLDEILEQYGSGRTPPARDVYPDVPYSDTVSEPSTVKTIRLTRIEFCDWLETLMLSVALVIFIMVFGIRVNQVYGISMQPTLMEGDRLIVTPMYGTPSYGDIIVLKAANLPNSQTGEMGEPIVKRVIGLPGDEIFIDKQSGEVFRNGEMLDETYIAEKILPERAGNQKYPITVEEGHVFVMGDNRNHSTDSRVTWAYGVFYYVDCVDFGSIIGKAVLRVYPFDTFGGFK